METISPSTFDWINSIFILSSLAISKKFRKPPVILLDEIVAHLDKENLTIFLDQLISINAQIFATGTDKKNLDILPSSSASPGTLGMVEDLSFTDAAGNKYGGIITGAHGDKFQDKYERRGLFNSIKDRTTNKLQEYFLNTPDRRMSPGALGGMVVDNSNSGNITNTQNTAALFGNAVQVGHDVGDQLKSDFNRLAFQGF